MNEKVKAKCAVPDCNRKATRKADISLDGAPKKRLPVCRCHADAAKEDDEQTFKAFEQARDTASATAEKHMAQFIDTLLLGPAGFKRGIADIDTPIWRSKEGWFKLAFIHVDYTDQSANFTFSYNIEFDLNNRELCLRGEFDAATANQIARAIHALRMIH